MPTLLNAPLDHCSAAAMLRMFRNLLRRGGARIGFPTLGLAQLYVPGSCRAVLRSGGQVLFGARVAQLLVAHGRLEGVRMQDGHVLSASRCVLALPPQETGALATGSGEAALEPLAGAARYFRPSPALSSYLWFDRPIGDACFWARAWTQQGLNTAFQDLARIRPGLAGRASVVACSAVGSPANADWPDERIVEHSWREIAEFAPQARQARVLHARVHRAPMAIPQPRPGTEAVRPPAATRLPGLWVAGDWTGTGVRYSLESAARSGALAAEAVLADAGRPARLALEPPRADGLRALFSRD
jgi:15-cis-phytoene desaturase